MDNQHFNQNQMPQQPQQSQMPQIPQMPQMPQMPQQPKKPLFDNDMLGVISCVGGLTGFGLGLLSAILSDNFYGILNTAANNSTVKSAEALAGINIQGGISPVFSLILCIIALILCVGSLLLALKVNSDNARAGKPKGVIPTLGLIFGCAGFIVCVVAMFITSCSTCSYCSIESAVNKTTTTGSAISKTPSVSNFSGYLG